MTLPDIAYALSIGPHYLWHRFKTGRYGPAAPEKTGAGLERLALPADARTVWFHAVSVGEAVAARDLVRMFMADNPDWRLRVSTTTATGRAIAEKDWGADKVFYYPLDFSSMVRRTFDAVRPSLIVLMELEIWPNFLAEAARRNIPVVVANARITDRSKRRLSLIPSITRRMVCPIRYWLAQTAEYAQRLRQLGVDADKVEITGSVKYDAVPLELDHAMAARYRALFGCTAATREQGGSLLVVAGSTHPGEEKILLQSLIAALPHNAPKPRVVLAPRHPERLDAVQKEAEEFGRVVRRSALPDPDSGVPFPQADIILVDTMGELAHIYSAADLVFVGGTLIPHGGQNFIEPCGLAKPTIVGPNLWNFADPAELLRNNGCLTVVHNEAELLPALTDLLSHPADAHAMGDRARDLLLRQRGAARRMANRLNFIAQDMARRPADGADAAPRG